MSGPRVVSTSWHGEPLSVSCRMVSRYAWTSASIDVAIGDSVILRTGGVLKLVGTHAESFEYRGTRHAAELTWGVARWHQFPFTLTIDGMRVLESRVPIANWWLSWWPFFAAIAAALVWLILR
jgi:hypothetical protein